MVREPLYTKGETAEEVSLLPEAGTSGSAHKMCRTVTRLWRAIIGGHIERSSAMNTVLFNGFMVFFVLTEEKREDGVYECNKKT